MGVEHDTRKFLVTILNTIAVVLIWMILQVLLGIYLKLAFFERRPGAWNIAYYIFFVITVILLILFLKKKWRSMF